MNDALKTAGFALAAAAIAFVMRSAGREAGKAVALAAGMMLFYSAITRFSQVTAALQSLSRQAGMGNDSLQLLLKMLGMAYVSEFAVQSCRDAGEEGLAMKAALCGKMLLLTQLIPLIGEISRFTLALTA